MFYLSSEFDWDEAIYVYPLEPPRLVCTGQGAIYKIIIPMFYINYLTMYKVHMLAGAMRTILYGRAYVGEIIHSLKHLPVHTLKPYAQTIPSFDSKVISVIRNLCCNLHRKQS